MPLLVENQPLIVHLSVEVNGEVGNSRDGSFDPNQVGFHVIAIANGDPPREPEISVGPSGE